MLNNILNRQSRYQKVRDEKPVTPQPKPAPVDVTRYLAKVPTAAESVYQRVRPAELRKQTSRRLRRQ